ncbi:MAG: orotidine 5'-phosphate decarboxylase [Bdellovibrionales bacterium RIFOXYD1_FULL_53_11]|nr:MAG: orotidine 5'-phosphate decarboxylase [Bdellovibrionales bacterium RIFOXYD1_FULL_53_11]
MPDKTELIVALDHPALKDALALVDELDRLPVLYKVGSGLFMAAGPDVVRELVSGRGKRVFLDLKFHDIPNTVEKAALQAALLGVEMFTLHLAGGRRMVSQTSAELTRFCNERGSRKPRILGVSVLTSFDGAAWSEVTTAQTGHAASPAQSLVGLVSNAALWGADGIVCSPLELEAVRARFPGLYTVVPGIRPKGAALDDQARVMTPTEARVAGANAIVVGRPVTASADPAKAVADILQDLACP